MHYYKRNIGDYAKKAGRLSVLEHGAYTLLIDACYDRERFPTKDEALNWTWARTEDEVRAVEFVLSRFFDKDEDGRYVQSRIQEEIERYHQNAETNKRIAREREGRRRTNRSGKGTKRDSESTKRAKGVDEPSTKQHEPPPNQEPETKNQEPRTSNNPPAPQEGGVVALADDPDPVVEVFNHWKTVMGKTNGVKLTAERRKKIQARLREGYTVDQLKQAVDGCASSPFHMGQDPKGNPEGTIYDGLDLICRSGSKVEGFIQKSNSRPPQQEHSQRCAAWLAGSNEPGVIQGEAYREPH